MFGSFVLCLLSGAGRTSEGVFVIKEADLAVAYSRRTSVAGVQLYVAPSDKWFFRPGALKSIKFYEDPTAFGPHEEPSAVVLECYAESLLPADMSLWLSRSFQLANRLEETAKPREAFCREVGLEPNSCPPGGSFRVFDIKSRAGRGKFYVWRSDDRVFALAWKEPRRLGMQFFQRPIHLRLWRASSAPVKETVNLEDRMYQVYFDHVHRVEEL